MSTRPIPWTTYVSVALAVLGLIWTAAREWQALQDRVSQNEQRIIYYHGDFPKGVHP